MKQLAAFKEWLKDIIKRRGLYRDQLNKLSMYNLNGKDLEVEYIKESDILRKSDIEIDNYKRSIFERKTSTSGTTGEPLVFYQTVEALQKEQAFIDWLWNLVDHDPSDRVVVMRGGKGLDLTSRFYNRLLLSSFEWDEKSLRKKHQEFLSFNPRFIDCYPSILERFLKGCIALGITKFPAVRGILAGSEACLDHQANLFKEILGAETLNWYGQSEQVALGLKIDKDTFHFFPQYSTLKFLPNDNKFEITGKSHISKFFSRFYYGTGDYCKSIRSGFNEKLNVPVYVVEGLTGRNPETIKLENSEEVPLNHIIFGLHSRLWSSVDRYCFVQIKPGIMDFYYSKLSTDKLVKELIDKLIERFPQGVELNAIEKPELSQINTTKWRYYFPNKNKFERILSENN
jgi:phenylacetate-CoA ligase